MKKLIGLMLLAGLAHGAGPYKVEDKSWNAQGMEGVRKIPAFYIGSIVLTDKEQAEDLAYALNRAHKERTDTACSYTEKMGSIYRKTYWDCTETGGSK